MRDSYTTITVPADLITQVLQELLAMASDPNMVDVTDGDNGRIILAHPILAEAWYQEVLAKENTSVPEPEPEPVPVPKKLATVPKEPEVVAESITGPIKFVAIANTSVEEENAPEPPPVKRGPGRPPKSSYTSASNGEEP